MYHRHIDTMRLGGCHHNAECRDQDDLASYFLDSTKTLKRYLLMNLSSWKSLILVYMLPWIGCIQQILSALLFWDCGNYCTLGKIQPWPTIHLGPLNSNPGLNFTSGRIIFHHPSHEQSVFVYYNLCKDSCSLIVWIALIIFTICSFWGPLFSTEYKNYLTYAFSIHIYISSVSFLIILFSISIFIFQLYLNFQVMHMMSVDTWVDFSHFMPIITSFLMGKTWPYWTI